MAVERHEWLRDALADKGLRAKDVAKAWGVDDAVVSRFIKTGEPELSFTRAEALCRMLGLTISDLQIKLADRHVPMEEPASTPIENGAKRALEKLQACAEECLRSLPKGFQVSVQIFYTGAS